MFSGSPKDPTHRPSLTNNAPNQSFLQATPSIKNLNSNYLGK
jgi:hypothetical protein